MSERITDDDQAELDRLSALAEASKPRLRAATRRLYKGITRAVKLKQRLVRLGLAPEQAARECGDEIY